MFAAVFQRSEGEILFEGVGKVALGGEAEIGGRSEGEILFEGVGKVALGGEAEIGGDGGKRFFRVRQQVAAFLKFFFLDKVGNRLSRFFFEFFGQVRAAHIEMGGDVFRGDRL